MEKNSGKLKSKKPSYNLSPSSGNKYKNFLSSILSPSVPKRRSKKAEKSPQPCSSYTKTNDFEEDERKSKSESIYSSIEHPVHLESVPASNGTESCASQETIPKGNVEQNFPPERLEPKIPQEPLYATVHKEDKRILQERLKELTEENRHLRKQIQDFLQDEKRKEETHHAQLQLKILQFETDTRKEVKSLRERIQILAKEKETLNEQIDILVQEKKELQSLRETTVNSQHHKNMLEEYRKALDRANARYEEKVNTLLEESNRLEKKNTSLSSKVTELSKNIAASGLKYEELKNENARLTQENEELSSQLEESKRIEQEAQKLLLSLLKVTESIAVERDILLDKASYQDSQQRALQTTVVDYSLNIGRLQEHISNLSKENAQEVQKIIYSRGNEVYEKQMDILRKKIIDQNNTINQLESDKKELELQVKSILESKTDWNK